jgi:hypothetical protein
VPAAAAYRELIRAVGLLARGADAGDPLAVAAAAGRAGRAHAEAFRDARWRLDRPGPSACAGCHRALAAWLDSQAEACGVLAAVGTTGALGRLREVQELMAEGRGHARTYNAEHARLVDDLRRRVGPADVRGSRRRGRSR